MERLKGKPSGGAADGQLVTREDGTQAIRVRKRKRRSEQPKREEAKRLKRLRVIQVSVALTLLILATLTIGGLFVYTNTAAYRKAVSNTVAEALGGSVEFKAFRVTPVSAKAEAVEVKWPEGSGLKALSLRGMVSKISPLSLFGSTLKGDEINAREGEMLLGSPQPQDARAAVTSGKPIQFNRLSVAKMDVIVGDPTLPALKLTSSEVALTFDASKASSSLKIHRGNLAIADWPVFKMDRALVLFQPGVVELTGLRINDSMTPRGSLELSGTLRPFDPTQKSTLKVALDNFNLADLLGKDLGKLLDARIDSRQDDDSNVLSFTSGAMDSVDLSIAFRNTLTSQITLKGFPFLLSLARTLGDSWYEQPDLEEAVGTIVRNGSTLELCDFDLSRKTHMVIKGNLVVNAAKNLSGSLEIGIPESVVQLSPNLKSEALFGPVRDGFRWLKLTLSGTLARPTDNFAEVYAAVKEVSQAGAAAPGDPAAAPAGSPASPVPAPEIDPGKAFDDLTKPAGR